MHVLVMQTLLAQVFEDIKFNKIDIAKLEIEDQPLGEGGFGAVYKAVYLTVML